MIIYDYSLHSSSASITLYTVKSHLVIKIFSLHLAFTMLPLSSLILGLCVIQPDGLSGLLRRRACPRLAATESLVMDHDQFLSGEAPNELPGHGGAEELLIGPSGSGDLGLSP